MTHPLTEGLCCQLWQDNKDNWLKLQEPCPATRRVMRAAADWQLEQVIRVWDDLNTEAFDNGEQLIVAFDQRLRAMRPQQQEES